MHTFSRNPKPTKQSGTFNASPYKQACTSQSPAVRLSLHLHRTLNTQSVPDPLNGNFNTALPVQPQLMINPPNDIYELEANRVAEQVIRMPESTIEQPTEFFSPTHATPVVHTISRQVQSQAHSDKSEMAESSTMSQESHGVADDIITGTGHPLPASERSFFEPRFGVDFSNVRLHTDNRTARTSQSIDAKAFTV